MQAGQVSSPLLLILLGTSLLLQVWLTGMLLGVVMTTLICTSLCLITAGLLVTGNLRVLAGMFFRLSPVPGWMEATAIRHARQLGLAKPELYQVAGGSMNAFALAGQRRRGIILIDSQLVQHLTHDEIEAVIAHELVHIAERHATVMTFVQGMALPVVLPVAWLSSALLALVCRQQHYQIHFSLCYRVASMLLFPLSALLITLISRYWEYRTDAQAAHMVGRQSYIDALRCLHDSIHDQPDDGPGMTLTAARKTSRNDWALSHPGLDRRINALRELA